VGFVLLALALAAMLPGIVRWRASAPLSLTAVTVTAAAPPTLSYTGSGLDRRVQALLLADPAIEAMTALAPPLPLYQLATDGRLAVASTRDLRIVTIDVRDGQRPRLLGSIKLQHPLQAGTIGAVAQLGGRAVAALTKAGGVVLLDVDDPQNPRLLHHLPLPGDVADLLTVAGCVYAACRESGVWQVRCVGDRLQAVRLPGLEQAWRLARTGDRLAAVSLRGAGVLYDLDAAGHPRLAGSWQADGEVRGLAVGSQALYLSLADGTLCEYALAAWPRLQLRARLQLPGRPFQLQLNDDTALLVSSMVGAGACLIDVRQAGAPTLAGWLAGTGETLNNFVLSDGRLLAVNSHGLRLHRLDDLRGRQPTVAALFADHKGPVRLANWQGRGVAYAAGAATFLGAAPHPGAAGLLAVPAVPVGRAVHLYRPASGSGAGFSPAGTIPVDAEVAAVLQRDDRLYVLGREELIILARMPTGDWARLGHFAALAAGQALAWAGPDRLLVADRHRGLFLLDISEPSTPRLAASQLLPEFLGKTGGIYDLLVSGERAYVARSELGVQVFDLSRPGELQVVQQIDTPGLARRLALHDDLLLVADRGRGIQVIDTRTNPCQWVATLAVTSFLADMVVQGEEILVVNTAGMLARLPVPQRLPGVRHEAGSRGRASLPDGLAAGAYQLVLYDGTRRAKGGLTWPGSP
jgi:hypothetical protein